MKRQLTSQVVCYLVPSFREDGLSALVGGTKGADVPKRKKERNVRVVFP